MFTSHQTRLSRVKILTLAVGIMTLMAASIAVLTPSASAQAVSGVSPVCPDGVKAIDESTDRLWCALPDSLPLPDGPVPCPAGSKRPSELGIDSSQVVGMNRLYIEGSCYYPPTCPAGFSYVPSLSSGDTTVLRLASCQPDGPGYSLVGTADDCAAAGAGAQWYAGSGVCGVAITPPVVQDGVSNQEQDCFAAGGELVDGSVCALRVWSNTPQPTVPPPVTPTAVPTATVGPTATAGPTVTPVPTVTAAPTATPGPTVAPTATASPVVPTATAAPATPTPTPKHPGFGFTG